MNSPLLTVIPGTVLKQVLAPRDNLPLAFNVFKDAPGAKVHLIKNPPGAVFRMADIDVMANTGPRSKTKSTYGFTAPAAF